MGGEGEYQPYEKTVGLLASQKLVDYIASNDATIAEMKQLLKDSDIKYEQRIQKMDERWERRISECFGKVAIADGKASKANSRLDRVLLVVKAASWAVATLATATAAIVGWVWSHGREAVDVGRTIINHK